MCTHVQVWLLGKGNWVYSWGHIKHTRTERPSTEQPCVSSKNVKVMKGHGGSWSCSRFEKNREMKAKCNTWAWIGAGFLCSQRYSRAPGVQTWMSMGERYTGVSYSAATFLVYVSRFPFFFSLVSWFWLLWALCMQHWDKNWERSLWRSHVSPRGPSATGTEASSEAQGALQASLFYSESPPGKEMSYGVSERWRRKTQVDWGGHRDIRSQKRDHKETLPW